MPVFSFEGKTPNIHPSAFIAATASVVGDVTIEENASVWYGAVVRGDFGSVLVKAGANIQDGSVVHGAGGTVIGAGATIAHNCIVHGATIGEEALIANGSTVLDGAKVGSRTVIAAGSIVTANMEVPDGVIAMGIPAVVRGPVPPGSAAERWVKNNPTGYQNLAKRHKAGVKLVE